MNNDESKFDTGYYIYITIGAIFSAINIKRWFKNDDEIKRLKAKIFELENELIAKNDIIRVYKDFLKK